MNWEHNTGEREQEEQAAVQVPLVQVEDIRPTMTVVDRQRALDEIVRVLRGEE